MLPQRDDGKYLRSCVLFLFMVVPHIQGVITPFPDATRTKLHFHASRNRIMPYTHVHACIIYTNGDAILHSSEAMPFGEDRYNLEMWTDARGVKDVATILLSPSSGDWEVDEVTMETQYESIMFIKNDRDFEGTCTYLPWMIPSKEKIQAGLREYQTVKREINATHALLTGLGVVGMHALHAPEDVSSVFAIGGLAGLAYQGLIQMEIDQVGNTNKNVMYRLLANSFFRLGFIASMFLLATTETSHMNTSYFSALCVGFLLNKVAMYITFTKKL